MFRTFFLALNAVGLGVTLALANSHGSAPVATPRPAASAPAPKASPTPEAPLTLAPLTQAESRTFLYEFQRAQAGERRALEHRQKSEMKELKASQEVRLKEWQAKETEARREFFRTHKGAEKREYMRDLQARRKSLVQILSDEKNSRAREHDVRYKALIEDQKQKLIEVQAGLKQGQRPLPGLWPSASP